MAKTRFKQPNIITIDVACAGTMDTVASCHRTPFSPHKGG